MDAIFWGIKIIFFIFVAFAAFAFGIAGLALAPGLLLIYAGIKVGGMIGGVMLILGVLLCIGVVGFFVKDCA